MPVRPCLEPGCPALVPEGRCQRHAQAKERERGSARERGYDSRWDKARRTYLSSHPLCVLCYPRVVPASVVDHIRAHKGDQALFWDESNWRAVCRPCHDARTDEGDFGREGR